MENKINNSIVTESLDEQQVLDKESIKPKKNLFVNILLLLISILGLYVVVGIILIAINPLFGLLVLYPVFLVQGIIGNREVAVIEQQMVNVSNSEIILPSELNQSDCVGLLFTSDFRNLNNPRIQPYVNLLKPERFDNIGVCTTSYGNIVVKTLITNTTQIAEIYLDNQGNLTKLIDINESVFEFAEDSNGNLYLLVPSMFESAISREAFVYDNKSSSFLRVVKVPDIITVCPFDKTYKCQDWRLGNTGEQVSDESFPMTCTDSDGSKNFGVAGKTEVREGTTLRGSGIDSCHGNFLTEYVCGEDQCSYSVVYGDSEGGDVQFIQHVPYDGTQGSQMCTVATVSEGKMYDCTQEGKVCKSGACVFE